MSNRSIGFIELKKQGTIRKRFVTDFVNQAFNVDLNVSLIV